MTDFHAMLFALCEHFADYDIGFAYWDDIYIPLDKNEYLWAFHYDK